MEEHHAPYQRRRLASYCQKYRIVVHLFLSGTVPIARKAQFGDRTRGPGFHAR